MIKIRIDVEPDVNCPNSYHVTKWIFEKKTGRTLDHHRFSMPFTKKAALELKHDIINSYKEM